MDTGNIKWDIWPCFADKENKPDILDPIASIDFLVSHQDVSISRMGDGELGLATGVCTPNTGYQGHDENLRRKLVEALRADKDSCKIGIPKWFLYSNAYLTGYARRFVYSAFAPAVSAGDYFRLFRPDYTYLDGSISVPNEHYACLGLDFVATFYKHVANLFKGKDIILVTGDNRYCSMQYRLLDELVSSMFVVKVPHVNSWTAYQPTKSALLRKNGSGRYTVVLSCGPLASVLAYELSDDMRCLDIGHMLVDYNKYLGGSGVGAFWH